MMGSNATVHRLSSAAAGVNALPVESAQQRTSLEDENSNSNGLVPEKCDLDGSDDEVMEDLAKGGVQEPHEVRDGHDLRAGCGESIRPDVCHLDRQAFIPATLANASAGSRTQVPATVAQTSSSATLANPSDQYSGAGIPVPVEDSHTSSSSGSASMGCKKRRAYTYSSQGGDWKDRQINEHIAAVGEEWYYGESLIHSREGLPDEGWSVSGLPNPSKKAKPDRQEPQDGHFGDAPGGSADEGRSGVEAPHNDTLNASSFAGKNDMDGLFDRLKKSGEEDGLPDLPSHEWERLREVAKKMANLSPDDFEFHSAQDEKPNKKGDSFIDQTDRKSNDKHTAASLAGKAGDPLTDTPTTIQFQAESRGAGGTPGEDSSKPQNQSENSDCSRSSNLSACGASAADKSNPPAPPEHAASVRVQKPVAKKHKGDEKTKNDEDIAEQDTPTTIQFQAESRGAGGIADEASSSNSQSQSENSDCSRSSNLSACGASAADMAVPMNGVNEGGTDDSTTEDEEVEDITALFENDNGRVEGYPFWDNDEGEDEAQVLPAQGLAVASVSNENMDDEIPIYEPTQGQHNDSEVLAWVVAIIELMRQSGRKPTHGKVLWIFDYWLRVQLSQDSHDEAALLEIHNNPYPAHRLPPECKDPDTPTIIVASTTFSPLLDLDRLQVELESLQRLFELQEGTTLERYVNDDHGTRNSDKRATLRWFVRTLLFLAPIVWVDESTGEPARLRRLEVAGRALEAMSRPLTDEEIAIVQDAIEGDGSSDEILYRNGNALVTRHSMRTLAPGEWIGDEVIQFYFRMLAKRDEELCREWPSRKRCHFFNTAFMTRLLNEGHWDPELDGQYDYRKVERWSTRVPGKDIFKLDKMVFPINHGRRHWVCAVAFMQEKRIQFYDSMGAGGIHYLEQIFRYIRDEHEDKKKSPLPDRDAWQLVPCALDTPRQTNGYDCGVFCCTFADFVTMEYPLVFNQTHISIIRKRIALSIMQAQDDNNNQN